MGIQLVESAVRDNNRKLDLQQENMIAKDLPGFRKTSQETTVAYSNGKATGISVGKITQLTDPGLEHQIRTAQSKTSRAEILAQYESLVETNFGQLGSEGNLASMGNRVVVAVSQAIGSGGSSEGNKKAVIKNLEEHFSSMKMLSSGMQRYRSEADGEREKIIKEVNQLLKDIAEINAQTPGDSDTTGASIGYLRQRNAKLEKLAELIEFRIETINSDFLLYTPTGKTLIHNADAGELLYTSPGTQITAGTVLPPILLRTIHSDESLEKAQIIDVTSDYEDPNMGGKLAGITAFLNSSSSGFSSKLDNYACAMRDTLNEVHNKGAVLGGRSIIQGNAGYIGGNLLTTAIALEGEGALKFAIIDQQTYKPIVDVNIDLSAIASVADLITAIESAVNVDIPGFAHGQPYVDVSVTNGALRLELDSNIATSYGIALGSADGQAEPKISAVGGTKYGFSEFFHLNDLIVTTADNWRGKLDGDGLTIIEGLAEDLAVSPQLLNITGNAKNLSLSQLRSDTNLSANQQAVSSDLNIARSIVNAFTLKTAVDFKATASESATKDSLEGYAVGLYQEITFESKKNQGSVEVYERNLKNLKQIFDERSGLTDTEIATNTMKLARQQELLFSFMSTYFRMQRQVADLGKS